MTAVLYRIFDSEAVLLYVGSTMNISARITAHVAQQTWAHKIATITVEHFGTKSDALEAEGRAIYFEKPIYNRVVTTAERREVAPQGRPLAKDADKALAQTKPWIAAGMSRRTWFRRRAEAN